MRIAICRFGSTQDARLVGLGLLATILFLSSTARGGGPVPGDRLDIPGFEKHVYKTLTNAATANTNLYVFVCKPPDWRATDSRSAVVFIHGGAWQGGDPSGFAAYCRFMAERGMVAFSIEYRIEGLHAANDEKWNFWKSESDCVEAVRWIRSKAPNFGIASNRIAVGGDSVGGNATLCTAFGWRHVPAEFPCGDTNVSSVPDAVFLFNGAIGPCGWWYRKGDPVPPVFMLCGDVDGLCNPQIVSSFFKTAFASQPWKEVREYRSDITLTGSVSYAASHTCFSSVYAWEHYSRPAMADLEEWFAALGFLSKRQAPPLAESNGVCRFEAEDFSGRYPSILQNSPTSLVWQASYAKDASRGYLMECTQAFPPVPPSAETIDDAALPTAPRLEYRIAVSTPGRYHVWANVRTSWAATRKDKYDRPEGPYVFTGRKQLRLGVSDGKTDLMLSGTLVTTPDGTPSWQRSAAADPIVVTSPGVITLKVYAGGAGIRLDRIIFTTKAAYTPGPEEMSAAQGGGR